MFSVSDFHSAIARDSILNLTTFGILVSYLSMPGNMVNSNFGSFDDQIVFFHIQWPSQGVAKLNQTLSCTIVWIGASIANGL